MNLEEYIKENGFNSKDTEKIVELVDVGQNVYNTLKEGTLVGSLNDITPSEDNFENYVYWVHTCIEIFKECNEQGIELITGEYDKVGDVLTEILMNKVFEQNFLVNMEKV
tara:strand:- start:1018 stop:1347 length:330 start_codon:yes stop_codon:yes gene_type:complete